MAKANNRDHGLKKYADGTWGVDMRLPGDQRHRHKCGTKEEARAYYNEIKRRVRLGEVLPTEMKPKRTLGFWLDRQAELLGPKTRKNQPDHHHVKMWKTLVGQLLPEQLTAEELAEWVIRRNSIQKPAYIKRQLSVLRKAFSLAIEAKEIDTHPFTSWTRLGLPKHLNNRRETYLTEEQEAKFFEHFDKRWWPYAEFAVMTGMRWGDQFGLRREDIDLKRGVAMVQQSKHGDRQPIILSGHLVDLLTKLLASHQSEWVFPSPTGQRWNPNNFRTRHWRPAMDAAGIDKSFVWHSLRHTTASRLVDDGEDLYTVQHVLGQKDHRSTQRYAHLRDEKMKRAADRLATNRKDRSDVPSPGEKPKPKRKPKQDVNGSKTAAQAKATKSKARNQAR